LTVTGLGSKPSLARSRPKLLQGQRVGADLADATAGMIRIGQRRRGYHKVKRPRHLKDVERRRFLLRQNAYPQKRRSWRVPDLILQRFQQHHTTDRSLVEGFQRWRCCPEAARHGHLADVEHCDRIGGNGERSDVIPGVRQRQNDLCGRRKVRNLEIHADTSWTTMRSMPETAGSE
jgi:hypothetical protein